MYSKQCFWAILFLSILSMKEVSAQTFGIVYEASSLEFSNSSDYQPRQDGLIKNVFLKYDIYANSDFVWSLKLGYGWSNYKNSSHYSDGDEKKQETIISGLPIETEIIYKHFIERDSVYEPFIGLGIGEYRYTTKYIRSSTYNYSSSSPQETKTTIEGFGQYLTFGLNIHISEHIISCIQFKKMMLHNLSSKLDLSESTSERDILINSGIENMSISLGIMFNLIN